MQPKHEKSHNLDANDQAEDLAKSKPQASDIPTELDSSIKRWVMIGTISTVTILGSMIIWGTTAQLSSAVVSSGRIVVDSNTKEIAHLEGGIIKRLKIRNGSRVKNGDVLFSIDETRALATVLSVKSSLNALLAQKARLLAEVNEKSEIEFPDELTKQGNENAIVELLESEKSIYSSRQRAALGAKSILDQQREQLLLQVSGFESQLKTTKERREITQSELDSLSGLRKKGLVSQQRVLSVRRQGVELEGQIGTLVSEIARVKQAIIENTLEKSQLDKEFDRTTRDELSETEGEIAELREQMRAANDVLRRSQVRAPVSGTVVSLQVHAQGAIVQPGETILEIVPDQDRLTMELRIEPQDIDNVTLGQSAQVRLTGFKQRTTPLLTGSVSYISADVVEDPSTNEFHYQARVDIGKSEIERLGDQKLSPGMPTEVMIQTGSRTALQYLSQPIVESINRAWRED